MCLSLRVWLDCLKAVRCVSVAQVAILRRFEMISQAVYWESFLYHDPMPDRPPDSTHTVSVPYENLLTTESLLTLFDSRFVKRRAS